MRSLRSIVLLAAVCAAVVAPVAAAAAGAAAGTCPLPSYPGSGYFTSLTVKLTTCAAGRTLAVAYYRCRTRHGRKGRCTTSVLKYRCTEKRTSIPTQIDARVTCRRGSATVTHTYQQNI